MYADVVIDEPLKTALTYLIDPRILPELAVGSLVVIPVGKKSQFGIVIRLRKQAQLRGKRLKSIQRVIGSAPWAPPETLQLGHALSDATGQPLGPVLFRLIPHPMKTAQMLPLAASPSKESAAFARFHCIGVRTARITAYCAKLKTLAARDLQSLLILPKDSIDEFTQIAKTQGLTITAATGELSPTRQLNLAKQFRSGQIPVLIGTRHIVGWPAKALRLIIIDDVLHQSHLDEQQPYLDASTIGVQRAWVESCGVILGTALPTPGMVLAELNARAKRIKCAAPLAPVSLVVSPHGNVVPPQILERIEQVQGDCAVVAPRHGLGGTLRCLACDAPLSCPACQDQPNINASRNTARCYSCSFHGPIPTSCPQCNSTRLASSGIGTEGIERRIATALGGRIPSTVSIGTERILWTRSRWSLVVFLGADSALIAPNPDRSLRYLHAICEARGRSTTVVVATRVADDTRWQLFGTQPQNAWKQSLSVRKRLGLQPFRRRLSIIVSTRSLPTIATPHQTLQRTTDAKRAIIDILVEPKRYRMLIQELTGYPRSLRWRNDSVLDHAEPVEGKRADQLHL